METTRVLPRTRMSASYEEFLGWVGEDTGAPLITGKVIPGTLPKGFHQDLSGDLYHVIACSAGLFSGREMLTPPFEFTLALKGPSRQPDVMHYP